MPTVEENRSAWDRQHDWGRSGAEWSEAWGGPVMHWHGTILPRIQAFLPAPAILEIGPGFGRWTGFLAERCDRLLAVDLSEKCVRACRERFAGRPGVEFLVNDGRSLEMVPDGSVDFAFSFDSLVHADEEVLRGYVLALGRKLRGAGAAFIHHSNLGAYPRYYRAFSALQRIPKLTGLLTRLGLVDNVTWQWRAPGMSAGKMARFAAEAGLVCIAQELVTWSTRRVLVDCLTTLVGRDSPFVRENRVLANRAFMREAGHLARLAGLYDHSPAERSRAGPGLTPGTEHKEG
ncbi:MAG TPA: class I SAM-dependent methyltransferase [Planctomycetota bacterium]|nr:class I SAM-dependent methyltransferase [Planctomycetota bacterium]